MKLLVQTLITIFILTACMSACKPETATDDPVGTGQGKVKDMGLSQDSAAATKTVTYTTDGK
ncbi:hypothetical protein CNR22_20415 [Sphingobacteriaceae bacterium]|nr:hypothetical protein CNR22_20415 [Sphingobacteriaceae bacterium]